MIRNKKKGFTLVELLAVIVILAIILVIAVPKVMSVIEDSKKATLESTAKMIASSAEKAKVQNTVLGNSKEITCDSVAKINDLDYASCNITFEENTAKVTIKGKGKFEGLYVCNGTKIGAIAQKEECYSPLQVKHQLFLAGQEITPDKFEVTLTESDGSTKKLWSGGVMVDDSQAIIITSPNWPNNYPENSTDEIEKTFEDADSLEITFDSSSSISEMSGNSKIILYGNNGNVLYEFTVDSFPGETYVIPGNYVKLKIASSEYFSIKGFSATIKPMYNVESEYTISPSVVPNTKDNFDITITVKEQNIEKKITVPLVHDLNEYVEYLEKYESILNNGVVQTVAEYEGTTYDAGIRYVGANPNNKVYYNCEDTDSSGISYGAETYDYENSCEIWRIIGVFDIKSSTNGISEKRAKLININSTFEASWDSSEGEVYSYDYYGDFPNCSGTNCGWGINQWGESVFSDGTTYEGADLMRLLNGFYIGKDVTCSYCNDSGQGECNQTCTADGLKATNIKPLTANAKSMIGKAVWATYGVKNFSSVFSAPTAYLEEKGISTTNTGNYCSNHGWCNDSVERTTTWEGLVALPYLSDYLYSKEWLEDFYGWTISRTDDIEGVGSVFYGNSGIVFYSKSYSGADAYRAKSIFPSVYLKANIKVIGGNGDDKPYILSIQ